MIIPRTIEDAVRADFSRNKIIVLLGPRQVGKTTLLETLQDEGLNCLNLNCDDIDDAVLLEKKSSTELQARFQNYDMVFIDEAQRVNDIGLTLKKIGDLKK